jgi:hypothetical protein
VTVLLRALIFLMVAWAIAIAVSLLAGCGGPVFAETIADEVTHDAGSEEAEPVGSPSSTPVEGGDRSYGHDSGDAVVGALDGASADVCTPEYRTWACHGTLISASVEICVVDKTGRGTRWATPANCLCDYTCACLLATGTCGGATCDDSNGEVVVTCP